MKKRKYLVSLGPFDRVEIWVVLWLWWDSVGAELHAARALKPQPR
jgi:hypothetical protein